MAFILVKHNKVQLLKSIVKILRKPANGNVVDVGSVFSDIRYWFLEENHGSLFLSLIVFLRAHCKP